MKKTQTAPELDRVPDEATDLEDEETETFSFVAWILRELAEERVADNGSLSL